MVKRNYWVGYCWMIANEMMMIIIIMALIIITYTP